MGRFEAWDILKLGCFGVGTFWGLGRFGVGSFLGWVVLGLGHFEAWDVLELGCHGVGTFWSFVLGCFVGAPKILIFLEQCLRCFTDQ